MPSSTPESAAAAIRSELEGAATGAKRLKVRSLLRRFGYSKRSDINTAAITTALDASGIAINPAIVRLGDDWELDYEDWVYLSATQGETSGAGTKGIPAPRASYDVDAWFGRAAQLTLRSEREVETKFIIPLLSRLGYTEDDRFDGMVVRAQMGSKPTRLTIDCAVFDASTEALTNQPLLIVEAKREELLTKSAELLRARDQAKSYALWTRCDFYLVTDGRTLQLHDLKHWGTHDTPLFACARRQLGECFGQLHALASKPVLVEHYLRKQRTVEEVRELAETEQ
jgi:hypothetical protein